MPVKMREEYYSKLLTEDRDDFIIYQRGLQNEETGKDQEEHLRKMYI